MPKTKTQEKGGLCCPHCADSKFPCVTMEKQMRRGGGSNKDEVEQRDKRGTGG